MPDILTTIDSQWQALANSRRGQRTLARWAEAEPALVALTSLTDLAERARAEGESEPGHLDHRDQLQFALLRLAKTDPDAQLAILYLIRPALITASQLY